MEPKPHQLDALARLRNGSILVGGTGSGKSYVGMLYYYTKILGGDLKRQSLPNKSVDIYILTTAKKRDELDWEKTAAVLGVSTDRPSSINGVRLIVDSWNNIKKYNTVSGAFFIFDEQRSIGSGQWSKNFLKITKNNRWLMLTATPADKWMDLIPVFIAHGFYKNRTEFIARHVRYAPYTKYPKILGYVDEPTLERHKETIFVVMTFIRHTTRHIQRVKVSFDRELVKEIIKTEWNKELNRPIRTFPEQVHLIRKVINTDPSRLVETERIFRRAKRLIIFYNFNYELTLLKNHFSDMTTVAELNGKRHDPLPETESWIYLVQYYSGNEAWECFTTNHMLFYSQHYSYRIVHQSMGRIDRMTTTYEDLFYHFLISDSELDRGISRAYATKKRFNEKNLTFYKTQKQQRL
mgnify:CR=1 FL=1